MIAIAAGIVLAVCLLIAVRALFVPLLIVVGLAWVGGAFDHPTPPAPPQIALAQPEPSNPYQDCFMSSQPEDEIIRHCPEYYGWAMDHAGPGEFDVDGAEYARAMLIRHDADAIVHGMVGGARFNR